MDSFASGLLMFFGLVAFANYKNGTLGDWLKAKFLNAGAPVTGDSPFDVATSTLTGNTPATAVKTGLGGGLGALLAPVVGAITGVFGEQRTDHKHAGIDYAVPDGTAVKAARAGTVSFAGNQSGYGLIVIVDHGGGTSTKYAHLEKMSVTVGQQVSAGQTLGLSGHTGDATGPHVHFELTQNGKAIDPGPYLGTPASVGAALTA